MDRAARDAPPAEVIDFDEVLLAACPPTLRADLVAEAHLLAHAFAPEGRAAQLAAVAEQLASGARDAEIGRPRARQLAAAMRRLAREAEG